MQNLQISIITPTYNQAEYISDTIESVLNQNYGCFEHIVIDGGSTDGTPDILKKYKHLKWISEKDDGSAYAINKGIKMASGEIIAWLNSDDYYDTDVFNKINKIFFENSSTDLVIGNLTYVNSEKQVILRDRTVNFDLNYLLNNSADVIRQPSSFFRRSLFNKTGLLNTKYRLVFDFDLFIRMLKITTPFFLDENIAFYREHSNTLTRKGLKNQAVEIFRVSRLNGGRLFSKQTYKVIKKILYPGSFIVK